MKTVPEGREPPPTGLEQRLESLAGPPIPVDLLSRCLATIDPLAQTKTRAFTSRLWSRPRFAAAIAAVLLIGVVGFLARPQSATAASFLQAVRSTWTEVPACHRVVVMKGPELNRTIETWFVRGKGGRSEVRSAAMAWWALGEQRPLGISLGRARPSGRGLVDRRSGQASEFEHAGLIQNNESLLHWAETHKADIHIEPDTIEGQRYARSCFAGRGPAA